MSVMASTDGKSRMDIVLTWGPDDPVDINTTAKELAYALVTLAPIGITANLVDDIPECIGQQLDSHIWWAAKSKKGV